METHSHQTNKNEIITLILADMRNRKLLMGLEATGLSTDDFNTNLLDLIFSKMEIAKQYEVVICNWYEDSLYTLLNTDMNKFRENQLFIATGIYEALEQKKKHLQKDVVVKPKKKFLFMEWIGLRRSDN